MALQGDLSSFALPDVLRLLAGTQKSGVLQIAGASGSGEVHVRGGSIEVGTSSTAPKADGAAEVIYSLLRLEVGSFTFEEGEVASLGHPMEVDAALHAAEALLAEWAEVEAVVPSMDAWISLSAEPEQDRVELTRAQWRAVAAVGSGGTVRDLASALDLSDLDASRQVKELTEVALFEVRATHAYQRPPVELDSFDEFEVELADPMTEVKDLVVEDRPVVMEDGEGALLPEPLPGAGVAYEGEGITGSVDGPAFETTEAAAPVDEPAASDAESDSNADAVAETPVDADASEDDLAAADDLEAAFAAEDAPSDDASIDDEPSDEVESDDEPASEQDAERGSLLRFLSSVKP